MLQWNAELPARFQRPRARVGHGGLIGGALHGDGPVARQPVGPVVETGLQHLFDQKPAEARAVDEESALDDGSALHLNTGEQARFSVASCSDDPSFKALDAARLGDRAEETGVERRIELIGIAIGRHQGAGVVGRRGEPALARGDDRQGIVVEGTDVGLSARLQPVVMKRCLASRHAIVTERVDVSVSDATPILELDSQFECGPRGLHELGFVDPETLVECPDVRQRRFPDANRPDFRRLDQLDGDAGCLDQPRQGGRGHPSRRSASHDDNAPDAPIGHFTLRMPMITTAPRSAKTVEMAKTQRSSPSNATSTPRPISGAAT